MKRTRITNQGSDGQAARNGNGRSRTSKNPWPLVLERYLKEAKSGSEYQPRRTRRRFHGMDITGWQGFVHIDDVSGWVENDRLRYYLKRWRTRRNDLNLTPTTDDIYDIMVEADNEEATERKPFHVERIAASIARNGITDPLILFCDEDGSAELWDGNRRFFGTKHIMRAEKYRSYRDDAKWMPAFVIEPTGSPDYDRRLKHSILTECNFVEKDAIPWPAYVKAGKVYYEYEKRMTVDPNDPALKRAVKEELAKEYGLKGWRVVDRWIKMYDLALQFKEYQEEEHSRDEVDVDLRIQDKFEYFDELSKPGVWGALKDSLEARDEVFCWLWDDKFKAFTDVRRVPEILADPVARKQANAGDSDSVKRAIATVIANDPARVKDKEAANEKIKQFAQWLDSFKRGDFKQLDAASLENLRSVLTTVGTILDDVVKMLEGLLRGKVRR